ncbi:MAG TPA: hypothetical protein PK006_12170 [Saprospiraceae bacterium]|nr:hypothetical protein [Saprospiraceae bacterium]
MARIVILLAWLTLMISCKAKEAEKTSIPTNAPETNSTITPAQGNPNISAPPNFTPTTAPPGANEPPQNAKGVWHFICPKSCEGGAGLSIACTKCGAQLVHNKAYHD